MSDPASAGPSARNAAVSRTRVVVIGAGPAGLLLSHLLDAAGIECVLLENRSVEYVQGRIRAGVLEASTVDVLVEHGLGDRLLREGIEHRGIYLQWPGHKHHLDFVDLCGRSVTIYGQTEVVKDLVAARRAADQPMFFEIEDTTLHAVDSDRPAVSFVDSAGEHRRIECDVIAGCDGFHGPSRQSLPADGTRTWERTFPYAWLGILAEVAPSTDELIYAWHPDGFALHSLRSDSVSRLYLQVPADCDLDAWPDDRVWEALERRLGSEGWSLQRGPVTDKSVTPMRNFVAAPMRHGRLFLAGDAAHIVPPTGAKGLNLAVADVVLLARALTTWLRDGDPGPADAYSETALRRVWRASHFSWWMTSMLHRTDDPFEAQLQLSQLEWVCRSRAASAGLAENYAGLAIGY